MKNKISDMRSAHYFKKFQLRVSSKQWHGHAKKTSCIVQSGFSMHNKTHFEASHENKPKLFDKISKIHRAREQTLDRTVRQSERERNAERRIERRDRERRDSLSD